MNGPVIMWFRQDLRLSDHPALAAAAAAGPIIPVFILDDETPGEWSWGGASRWWLHKSLSALTRDVPLIFRRGRADRVLEQLVKDTGAQGLFFTRDYAPWSVGVESRINSWCAAQSIGCHRYGGFLLHEPEAIRNGSGEYFKVYTPFSKSCFAKGDPRPPKPAPKVTWWHGSIASDGLDLWKLLPTRPNWAAEFDSHWQPGEHGAHAQLQHFIETGLQNYADGRDRPDQEFVSRLSPYLHWGEISPAQAWHATRSAMDHAGGILDRGGEKFLKELLWREFSYHLLAHNPTLPTSAFRPEYNDFPWTDDPTALKAWQRGETGYPIVDAGMRELWATGYMHNRVRMIVASFLIKHLLVPWQAGERWFWDTLVDADIGNNAASWQWVAGCGADAAPYFRIFNPIMQGEKFDPNGEYVRRWIPELAGLSSDLIHKPWEAASPPAGYPKPIVDHSMARERALLAFQRIKKAA